MSVLKISDNVVRDLAEARACVDEAEHAIVRMGDLVELPVKHLFTPGLYVRQIFIPAGILLTSKIHRTTHPFEISQGAISVWSAETGTLFFRAPHLGVTTPGTRRILFAHEDTIWTTFHPTDRTTPEEVEEEIIEKHVNSAVASDPGAMAVLRRSPCRALKNLTGEDLPLLEEVLS